MISLPPGRPTFETSIAALRTTDARFPWVQPTAEEADAADALEVIHEHHFSEAARESSDGSWGICEGCGAPWPCETWLWGNTLAVQWVGRAAARVLSRYFPQPAPAPQLTRCCPELLCEHVFRRARRKSA